MIWAIVNAESIEKVCDRYVPFVDRHVEQAALVAWNEESCDLKRIYKLTQAHGSKLYILDKLCYFLDPFKISIIKIM